MKYKGKESDFQIICMSYLRKYYPGLMAFHVPNEGIRSNGVKSLIYGQKRKAMGVMAGVSDILIPERTKLGHIGCAIELKVDGGSLSQYQKEFLDKINKKDWYGCVCWSVDDFVNTIEKLY